MLHVKSYLQFHSGLVNKHVGLNANRYLYIMPLPLYDLEKLTPEFIYANASTNAKLMKSFYVQTNAAPQRKKIIGHFTHSTREDRVSQRTWYDNITYADDIREYNRLAALAAPRNGTKGPK